LLFFIAMRRMILLLFVLAAGCKIPTGPEYQTNDAPVPIGLYTGYQSLFPPAHYSGIFSITRSEQDLLDSSGVDTSFVAYNSSVFLFNKLGNLITIAFSRDSIKVDDSLYPFSFQQDLKFPSPVSWSMKGDAYFTSFAHSIASESPVEILSPSNQDSIAYDSILSIAYNAPGADSVTISELFEGVGQEKIDSSIDSNSFGKYREVLSPNSGRIKLLPFFLDTNQFIFFTPRHLQVTIAWAQADTIHVHNQIDGFATEVLHSRDFFLKK
jgi:hypothetical protein